MTVGRTLTLLSRRLRMPLPTARSLAPPGPHTRFPPKRRVVRRSSSSPDNMSSSPCPKRPMPLQHPGFANWRGITAPLDVSVNGRSLVTMTLNSQYSWIYNQYPFSNDPNADLLFPDQYITECACVPSAATPPPALTKPPRPTPFYEP